ncbi:MAG: hypothetical protein AW10_03936 [Candidatus Accumulibacter appositus]|uniref:Uncharacterized protein n=1 Tax=Candidatus Accumulibacter appositus TaxID=1454003 RepID=A0A011N3X3_9PROT|nr:MAG: hypothetical protein AW10_03936 [Candidatus Accumulibacter appositus]
MSFRPIVSTLTSTDGETQDQMRKLPSCSTVLCFGSRQGRLVEFLSRDLDREPVVIAFLSFCHRAEEKCFDTSTNDVSLAKASGASMASIENPVRLGFANGLLVAPLVRRRMGHQHAIENEKALRKQGRRQSSATDVTGAIAPTGRRWYSATPPRRTAKFCGVSSAVFIDRRHRRSSRPRSGHCWWPYL